MKRLILEGIILQINENEDRVAGNLGVKGTRTESPSGGKWGVKGKGIGIKGEENDRKK